MNFYLRLLIATLFGVISLSLAFKCIDRDDSPIGMLGWLCFLASIEFILLM